MQLKLIVYPGFFKKTREYELGAQVVKGFAAFSENPFCYVYVISYIIRRRNQQQMKQICPYVANPVFIDKLIIIAGLKTYATIEEKYLHSVVHLLLFCQGKK